MVKVQICMASTGNCAHRCSKPVRTHLDLAITLVTAPDSLGRESGTETTITTEVNKCACVTTSSLLVCKLEEHHYLCRVELLLELVCRETGLEGWREAYGRDLS